MTNLYESYVEQCKKKFANLVAGNNSGKVLIRYLRHRRGHRTGVIISWKDAISNEIKIGVSKCNLSCGDRWNKYVGLAKAIDGAVPVQELDSLNVPHSAIPDFNHQLERISKYFRVQL